MNVNSLTFDLSHLTETPNASKDQRTSKPDPEASQSGASAAANRVAEKPVVNGLGLELQFSTDQQTGQSVIRVRDTESGKVVRQIPSEEVLAFLRQLEQRKGLVLSRRF